MGRNAISWEDKLSWDLKYIEKVTFFGDLKLIWLTFKKVFIRSNAAESNNEIDIALDYGDELLKNGKISRAEYDDLETYARQILSKR